MTARLRWFGLAAITTLVVIALGHALRGNFSWAGPRPVPVRTAQLPASPEPPLADQPRPAPSAPAIAVPRPQVEPEGTECPQDPEPPIVSLRIRVPATAGAGQELEYRICIENRSAAPAHHVIVRNPIPEHARFVRASPEPNAREPELTWNLGTLEGCQCREITLILTPTGTGDVRDCARVQFEHGECVTTKIRRPALALKKCGPSTAVLNQTLTYQLCVENPGGVDATGVVVTDDLPEGLEHSSGKRHLTWDVGTLAAGQCRTWEYQVVAKAVGRHCNRAVAATPSGLRAVDEHCVTVAEARMTIVKNGPERRYVNLPTRYEITVRNTGSTVLDNVVVRDPLPAGMTFLRADGGQLVGNEVQWGLGQLQPGASRTVEIMLRADRAGRICNRVQATADCDVSAVTEMCTEFVGITALLIEVVDTGFDPIEVGGEARYTIIVRNQGTAAATNVKLDMLAPEQMTVTRVVGNADTKKEGQRIITQPFNLPARGEARFTVYGTALRAGNVRFKVDMTADQLTSGPVHEEESTTIFAEPQRREPPLGR